MKKAGLLTIKPEKDITRQENYVTVSHKHRRKNPHKILANQTQQCLLKNYIPQPSEIYSRLDIWKSTNVIYHIKSKDEKSSDYTTRWKKRAFDKIQ